MGHICFSALSNCYAPMWSYGEICVHCNCCGRRERGLEMWAARLNYHQNGLKDQENFDNWHEGLEKIQRRNVKLNITYHKKHIRKCEERISHFLKSVVL